MTELNDQTLLSHWYRDRNAEAFRVLASRHARMVYGTALRILRNPEDAEDVVQQSFLTLAETKRPPARNAAAWLHRTAYRIALSVIRARDRRNARNRRYAEAQPGSARTTWDDVSELIDGAVAALPAKYQEPIVLYFFQEQTHAAIASELGISRQAVTHRIGKGTEVLRKRLVLKGVVAPAGAALVNMIHQNASAAVPAEMTTELGKIALAATPSSWAALSSFTGGLAFKGIAVLLAVGLATWASMHLAEPEPNDAQNLTVSQVSTVEENGPPVPVAMESKVSPGAETADPVEEVLARSDFETVSRGPADEPEGESEMASVAGVVTLPTGQPFVNANVTLKHVADIESGAYHKGTRFELKADVNGRFEQHDVVPGEYSVLVTEPASNMWSPYSELARINLDRGESMENLELVFGTEGNFTVSGTVLDSAGRPLESVRVWKFGPVPRAAMTDAFGRFTLRYLTDDEISVHTDKRGYSGIGAQAQPGDQNVQMVMYGDGAIEGHVVDARTREPIAEFEASFMNGHAPTYRESLFGNARSFDNPDGEFEFPQVYAGDATVVVRAPGFAPAMTYVTVTEHKTARAPVLELDRSESAALTGQVVTEDGLPIAGAKVYMDKIPMPSARDLHIAAVTDALGNFEIANAPPEVVFLAASHPDYAPASGPITDATTILLKRAGRLVVEVVSNGEPMAKIHVSAHYIAEPRMAYIAGAITDAQGQAILNEVVPGRVRVEIGLTSKRTQYAMLKFEPGEEKTTRFHVAPAEAEVKGFVYRDGEPLAGGTVNLFVDTGFGFERFEDRLSADGSFMIRDVPLGHAQLIAMAGGHFQRAFVDEVPLVSGQVTALSVDMTAKRRVRGTISGVRGGEMASVMVLRGSMRHNEAIESAELAFVGTDMAAFGGADEGGSYESTSIEAGTYTLLLLSNPANDFSQRAYHESRVVEVSDDEDLIAHFELRY